MFMPLNKDNIRQIVRIQFGLIQKQLHENGVEIEATDEVLDYLGELGWDPQFGARPLKRVIQRKVLNELSKQILAGKITKDSVVSVELNPDKEIEFVDLRFTDPRGKLQHVTMDAKMVTSRGVSPSARAAAKRSSLHHCLCSKMSRWAMVCASDSHHIS